MSAPHSLLNGTELHITPPAWLPLPPRATTERLRDLHGEILAMLAEHRGDYLMVRWLPGGDDPASNMPHLVVLGLSRQGELALLEGHRVVCAPQLAKGWPAAKTRVLELFGEIATLGYSEVLERAELSETSLRCVLCALAADREIVPHVPRGPADWEAMTFARRVEG